MINLDISPFFDIIPLRGDIMDLKYQKFSKLYSEFINDNNLITLAILNIKELNISYIELNDICYYIILFCDAFQDYQTNIVKSLEEFINESDLLIHTPSNKYIVNNNVLKIDLRDIYNHYNDIKTVDEKFQIYLIEKYLKNEIIEEKKLIYRHVKKLI